MDVSFRKATMADAEILLRWRNDALTRTASIASDAVAWDDHVTWLETIIADSSCDLRIAVAEEPVGVVRIDHLDAELPELSWTVAPSFRKQGVGTAMILAVVADRPLVARIKRGNVGSQNIARATGFRLQSDGEIQIWRYYPASDAPAL